VEAGDCVCQAEKARDEDVVEEVFEEAVDDAEDEERDRLGA
jgi:hypothetical protein